MNPRCTIVTLQSDGQVVGRFSDIKLRVMMDAREDSPSHPGIDA
jgi:hypothetical protein